MKIEKAVSFDRCLIFRTCRQEFVNYLGYYSSHEEAMQNMMLDEVEEAKKFLSWIVEQGTFDCKTYTLWNKLLRSSPNVSELLCALQGVLQLFPNDLCFTIAVDLSRIATVD